MSKKTKKKVPEVTSSTTETVVVPHSFEYEEMLTELEAIVADAEVRLTEEES